VSAADAPRVTAAVLNYNGRHLLEVVLPSLAAQSYTDFETVVVDDCSTDDSRAYLRSEWPQVRVIETGPRNVGVAAALNVAVAAARGELVALLNNDVELAPRWLGELVAALDRHPEAATAAGKLLEYRDRRVIDGAGDIFTRAGSAWGRGGGQFDRGQYEREEDVFAPTAGAALYRVAALADVGPFEESFVAYFEDVDWGLRAQLAGYRSRYVPAAVGYHMGSQTTRGDANPRYYALQRRNILGVIVRDLPGRFLARNLHRIVGQQLLGLAYSARAGMLGVHLRALAAALRCAPRWVRERRKIQARRRIDPREFERIVSSRRH
jgi:GT2 family glycosyltransferase